MKRDGEDSRTAYMGYEDCLVLHVYTAADLNASLPGQMLMIFFFSGTLLKVILNWYPPKKLMYGKPEYM